MEVNCEGCAGCCLDWRALVDADHDHERRGNYRPLDDIYNLVPLTGDEVRGFVRAGYGDALVPRLFRTDGPSVTVGGVDLAAVDGRPAFLVGIREAPKPVAPFGVEPRWLPACVFLDPATLQCRLHGGDLYPEACATYPGDNLALGVETECERVERAFGGDRLLEADPGDARPLFSPGAVGGRVFVHPDPGSIEGSVARLAAGEPTRDDRAAFVAVAAASRPGTTDVDDARRERAREAVLAADSWVARATEDWTDRAADAGEGATDPNVAAAVEDERGAPATPGWDDTG